MRCTNLEERKLVESIVITSLSEYISNVSTFSSTKYLFRGENSKFAERLAGSLRDYDGGWNSKKDKPYLEMTKQFYHEVAHRISELERANFIAFSQHHGIPTNLLDITSSPLVALYFACLENKVKSTGVEENGYIYIFDDDYIDITFILEKYPNDNILDLLMSNNTEIIMDFLKLFEEYRIRHMNSFQFSFNQLISDFKYYFQIEEELVTLLTVLEDAKDDFGSNLKYYELTAHLREISRNIVPTELHFDNIETYAFLCLVRKFFDLAKSYQEPIHNINFLPNFYYKPLLVFERGRNQHGSFMYQSFLSYMEPVYDYYVLMRQQIRYKTFFRIENRKQIMSELDNIGINLKYIFGDFDSIAKYICQKYD